MRTFVKLNWFLIVVMVLGLSFAIVGCDKGDDDDNGTTITGPSSPTVTGEWDFNDGVDNALMTLTQTGTGILGTLFYPGDDLGLRLSGSINGYSISLASTFFGVPIYWDGILSATGTYMSGSWRIVDPDTGTVQSRGSWTARKL